MGPDLPSPSVSTPPPPASCPDAPLLQEAFPVPGPSGAPFYLHPHCCLSLHTRLTHPCVLSSTGQPSLKVNNCVSSLVTPRTCGISVTWRCPSSNNGEINGRRSLPVLEFSASEEGQSPQGCSTVAARAPCACFPTLRPPCGWRPRGREKLVPILKSLLEMMLCP